MSSTPKEGKVKNWEVTGVMRYAHTFWYDDIKAATQKEAKEVARKRALLQYNSSAAEFDEMLVDKPIQN